ncbi:MAG: N-acetyl-gamma-glutamyl-phosphate reductase [Chloroflexi bacterium]|jgi:N-acetyl-gamma-glutamyl-phosphate reductase|nr:N-acetyl-gamma-glutamyl-phosphate reductase [Chloroflexota bacterium]MBT4073767.1 N-acetyl-gamma-glutamyl-phosphate reductase [Chloroflexota bacterium]MBT4514084.1 N-acetyl-gamma-glutamyl-phosphate reductase [Chloroflexota bacterium]MBT5320449.1 N-acetyl-gamma-glutamyl-phosphate reductase [Chloroflexota bacterium]
MANSKVFIDGSYGTTGLRIKDRLEPRDDLDVVVVDKDLRRDVDERRDALVNSDLAILCLPDDAAIEAAEWAAESGTKIVDPSTAHRVADGWVYGLPEMTPDQRDAVRESNTVANPGCYPTGVVLCIRPLTEAGIVSKDMPLTIHALSGYSGGGKNLIAKWEGGQPDLEGLPFESPYALHTKHKHVPEMQKYSGLTYEPQFIPSVGPFLKGMRVEVPLHKSVIQGGANAETIHGLLDERYADEPLVNVVSLEDTLAYSDPAFDPQARNDNDGLDISVVPNELGHVLLVIQIDNLGKGASGAAIQNMNLMLDLPEHAGLTV